MTGDRNGPGARIHVAVIALEWPSSGRHAGGVGRYAKRLCEWLSTRVALSVITGPDPEPLDGDGELISVDVDHPGGRLARYYVAPLRAARLVQRLKPDVVHSHGDDWPLALRSRRYPPVVRTYYGRSAAEARRGPLVRRANLAVLAGLEAASRSRFFAAVGIGPDSASAFRCDRLVPPVFGLVGAEPAAKHRTPLAVFVGEFGSRKRGHLALRAVVEARRSVEDLGLVVVGPESDRGNYPDWVNFHGALDDESVRRLIGRAWVLLAPSSYEGFGIPVWEAMAEGTPVLATRNPGVEFLCGGRPCCTVGEPQDLAQELLRLVGSEEARAQQARLGLVRAKEVADQGSPENYLELFEKAVAGR